MKIKSQGVYEIGAKGLQRIDVPANSGKNSLPLGTVLHWGGNMGFPAQDFAIVRVTPPSETFTGYGARYDCISLETFDSHRVEAMSIKTSTESVWHGQHFFLTERVLSGDEILELVEKNKAKIRADEEAKEAKAKEQATRREKIKALHPDLEQVPEGGYPSAVLAAKNIRRELKKAFPGVKFSVRSRSFSGGDSVDIGWTDGPTSKAVEAITGKYQEGSFDGMTDCYNYDDDRVWTGVFGGAKYVMEQRNVSPEAYNKAAAQAGYPQAIMGTNGVYDGVDFQTDEMLKRKAWETAF